MTLKTLVSNRTAIFARIDRFFHLPKEVKDVVVPVSSGAMLVDMSSMKRLKFDKKTMTIMSEAGALWSGAQDLIKDENVAFVGGGCPSVGIAGLVLGGGIGWLSRSRGLASDNVVSMEVSMKDGQHACRLTSTVARVNVNFPSFLFLVWCRMIVVARVLAMR